jgi:tetratricopeptide (TPR) repeat protein
MARDLADRPQATRDHIYNYAWLAVTVEPDDMQEPKRALPYAQKAVEMDQAKDEYSLHVLAQAYAGVGDYQHAMEAEEKGLALYAPLAPGAPKTGMQQTMESMVQICRDEIKKHRK